MKSSLESCLAGVFFEALDALGTELSALENLKIWLKNAGAGGNALFPTLTSNTAAVLLSVTESSVFTTVFANPCHS